MSTTTNSPVLHTPSFIVNMLLLAESTYTTTKIKVLTIF